jgi:hypothetical protein
MRRTKTICAGLAVSLLAAAAMQLWDAAFAGGPIPRAGTETLGAPDARTPSWDRRSGAYLVPAYLERRRGTKPGVFKVYPEYFHALRPSCKAQPRAGPPRGERSGAVRRLRGCQEWICTQWYAPLNCCVRWECSQQVFR